VSLTKSPLLAHFSVYVRPDLSGLYLANSLNDYEIFGTNLHHDGVMCLTQKSRSVAQRSRSDFRISANQCQA
jgi:hypothetical protein